MFAPPYGFYPTMVDDIYRPGTVTQLQRMLRQTSKPVSIGGGRYSMGGQVGHEGSLHIDMGGINRVLEIEKDNKSVRVEAGATWRDIQLEIGRFDLSISIIQTYANFSVGGSLSVNCHGRYVGLGPIILSVLSVKILTHDGTLLETSPEHRADIFFDVTGGYGALGIIVEAVLRLADNVRVERVEKKMELKDYPAFFRREIREDKAAIFHNADIIPPKFRKARVFRPMPITDSGAWRSSILKGLYEKCVGRFTRWMAGNVDTQEDRIIAAAHKAYSDLLVDEVWYVFNFDEWSGKIWRDTRFFGDNFLRKIERKLFFTLEFKFKAFYARLISEAAAATAEGESSGQIYIEAFLPANRDVTLDREVTLVARQGRRVLLSCPRWGGFTRSVPPLLADGVVIDNVSGNDRIAVSFLADEHAADAVKAGDFLFDSRLVTTVDRARQVRLVNVAELADLLSEIGKSGGTLEHIYDY